MIPYISVPKSLFELNMSVYAKYIYMLMLDRYKLSYLHDWKDSKGIYIYYTLEEIAKATGKTTKTAAKIITEIEKAGLITKKKQGQGKPTKIYLQESDMIFLQVQTGKNYESRPEKNTGQDRKKIRTNKNKNNKNNNNNNYVNNSESEELQQWEIEWLEEIKKRKEKEKS